MDYFERVDVLQKLLGYVTGQIEGEEKGQFKCVFSYSWVFWMTEYKTILNSGF